MNFGRYEILEEIGKGSMGVVYRAHDPQIDRIIALKVLRHDRVISDDFVRRFLKEARVIGRLAHTASRFVVGPGTASGSPRVRVSGKQAISGLNAAARSRRVIVASSIGMPGLSVSPSWEMVTTRTS